MARERALKEEKRGLFRAEVLCSVQLALGGAGGLAVCRLGRESSTQLEVQLVGLSLASKYATERTVEGVQEECFVGRQREADLPKMLKALGWKGQNLSGLDFSSRGQILNSLHARRVPRAENP